MSEQYFSVRKLGLGKEVVNGTKKCVTFGSDLDLRPSHRYTVLAAALPSSPGRYIRTTGCPSSCLRFSPSSRCNYTQKYTGSKGSPILETSVGFRS